LRAPAKIREALGRLKERYPRVARYYTLAYDDTTRAPTWTTQAPRPPASSVGTFAKARYRQLTESGITQLSGTG